MKIRNFFLLSAFLGVSCATQHMAERPFEFERAPLSGMVYDTTSNPVPGASLAVDGRPVTASDVYGRFLIPDMARGSHTVSASKKGYEPAEMSFEFLNKTHILYVRLNSFEAVLSDAEKAIEDGNWGEASALLERAGKIETGTGFPIVRFLSATLSFRKSEYASALENLESILESGYRLPAVYLFLADIYEKGLGDTASAVRNLELYLELKEDTAVARRLRNLRS